MRILAIYPAFDAKINEMASVWTHLCSTHDVSCTVLAGARDELKAHHAAHSREEHQNLEIHRFAELRFSPEMRSIVERARPDVIHTGVHENVPLALSIQKHVHSPILLHTEYFFLEEVFLKRRYYLGIPALRPFAGSMLRRHLASLCSRIVVSNPAEQHDPRWKRFPHLRYLPWPHPEKGEPTPREERTLNFSAFIGSMSKAKGARRLEHYFSALLHAKEDFQILLVGPAVDREGVEVVASLRARFGERVQSRVSCPRPEAMQLLRRSLFTLSPTDRLGWGLIGDSWGTGTPVISTAEHYDLHGGQNCLIARTPAKFVDHVSALQTGSAVWDRIVAGGRETVSLHAVERVSEQLYGLLKEAVG